MTEPEPRSLVTVSVGGRLYAARTHPSCRVCQHPNRADIEQQIINGRSYRAVASWVQNNLIEPDTGSPSDHSIRNHVQSEHMPLNAMVQRALIERRSAEIGRSIEEGIETLVDYSSANQMVIERGFERLQAGEIQPSMGDLLAAIRNQHSIDTEMDQPVDSQAWQQALMEYMAIVSQLLTADQKQKFAQLAGQNAVLQGLERQQTRAIEGDVA